MKFSYKYTVLQDLSCESLTDKQLQAYTPLGF